MGAAAAIFKMADMNSMTHISANNIDRKLIVVSMSMFSGSRNPNMAIILCQPLFFNMAATCYVLVLHYRTSRAITVVGIWEIVQSL